MSDTLRRALFLSTAERYIAFALNFLILAMVARLLSPAEIGLAVLGISTLSLSEAIRDFGASSYLVQEREVTQETIRTAFTVFLLLTVAICLALIAGAGLIAAFYNDERLANFIRVLALASLTLPFHGTLMALMRRDLQFGRLAKINVASNAASALVTILGAWAGASYMSFAWGALAASAVSTAMALAMRPTPLVFVPLLRDWRRVLAFGGVSSATILVNQAYNVLASLLMGKLQPLASVALFSRAQSICQIADKVVFSGVSSVALAVMARSEREGHSLKYAYLKGVAYITAVYWPILCLLALLAHPVVMVMLGERWHEVVPMVQAMALATLIFFPAVLSYPVLVASGGIADTLRASLISLPPSAVIIGLAATQGPLAVAASQFLTIPLQVLVVLRQIRRRIGMGWGELIEAVHVSAIVTMCAMAPAVLVVVAAGNGLIVSIPIAVMAVVAAALAWAGAINFFGHPLREEITYFGRWLSDACRRRAAGSPR